MVRLAALAALILAAAAPAAYAQTTAPAAPPAPPNCDAPEHRALDFWTGDWDLDFDVSPGVIGHATNHVTKDEYDNCVIAEHFFQPTLKYKGGSVSSYDRNAHIWRQTWVDSGGGYLVLTGGPVTGKPWIFELDTTEPAGPQKQMMRMIWQDVTPQSLVWRWQAQQADGTWKDAWVLRYKRHAPAA